MPDLLRVKAAFAVGVVVVPTGAIVAADDPIVAGRESLFAPVAPTFSSPARRTSPAPVVEEATAVPGEKRTTTRRTAKKV